MFPKCCFFTLQIQINLQAVNGYYYTAWGAKETRLEASQRERDRERDRERERGREKEREREREQATKRLLSLSRALQQGNC